MLSRPWLTRNVLEGLIVLSGGLEGGIGWAFARGRYDNAALCLDWWLDLCGDRFYLEVTRTARRGEQAYAEAALDLADSRGVPAVATNDVRFLARADCESHEARVCIQDGTLLHDPNRLRSYSEEQYLKTPAEMAELFSDAPELLQNSVEIAKRCSLDFKLEASMLLPAYPVPAVSTTEDYLCEEARRGLARLTSERPPIGPPPAAESYLERLEQELSVICTMGCAGFFLIVADFIRWARQHGVPVGPGRGSSAGSLIAYALGITDLDPIEHGLLFERFLNPDRDAMPDFDVDFCMAGRDKVIEYVAAKYGRERVSQIITYGTLAARAAVREVGRVLGHDYGYVDQIVTLIPLEIGITLDGALEKEEELKRRYESDSDVRELFDLARALEGLTRHVGTHAGGVVIAPAVLTDFTPLCCEEDSNTPVAQLDMHDVKTVGLVKFDFLGLRTLTVIDSAVREINAAHARAGERPLILDTLHLDDARTYQLIRSCDTKGIFQLQSTDTKNLIRRVKPDHFSDIVAMQALGRPATLQSGMVDAFIERKHGISGEAIDYHHVDLRPVLESTYGVILYQEQVMQIAHVLAGYTLSESDLFRLAFVKENPEEIATHRAKFLSGAIMRGVPEQQAIKILDLL